MSLDIISFICKLKETGKWKKLKKIKKATYNGDLVAFKAKPVKASPRGMNLEITLKPSTDPEIKIEAERRWEFSAEDPQEIKVDGQDVEPDDVHIEIHFRRFKFEIEYTLAWNYDVGAGKTLSLRSERLSIFDLF